MGGADDRPGGWVELTIPAALARAASEFGDTAALADPLAGAARVSYRELGERVTAVAGALIEAGVEPGDRVALWAPNGCEWVLIALGALGAAAAEGTSLDALGLVVRMPEDWAAFEARAGSPEQARLRALLAEARRRAGAV